MQKIFGRIWLKVSFYSLLKDSIDVWEIKWEWVRTKNGPQIDLYVCLAGCIGCFGRPAWQSLLSWFLRHIFLLLRVLYIYIYMSIFFKIKLNFLKWRHFCKTRFVANCPSLFVKRFLQIVRHYFKCENLTVNGKSARETPSLSRIVTSLPQNTL